MIMRSSIAFEDFLGSLITPQVMPPCMLVKMSIAGDLHLRVARGSSCYLDFISFLYFIFHLYFLVMIMRSAICWGLASKGCRRQQLLLSRFHSRFHLRFQFVLRSAQVTCGDSRGPTNLHFYNPLHCLLFQFLLFKFF